MSNIRIVKASCNVIVAGDAGARLVKPSEFFAERKEKVYHLLEFIGRKCNKTECKDSARFVRDRVRQGHLYLLEHFVFSADIVCHRATSHQLVRHRIGSYVQESQRVVDYDKELTVVIPEAMSDAGAEVLAGSAQDSYEQGYKKLRALGAAKELARLALPEATAANIVATFNLAQWRHVFAERVVNPSADPSIREVLKPLYDAATLAWPEVFALDF